MATSTRFATAIHTLALLGRQPEKLHSSESLAEKLQTNAVVIRRMLAHLQQAGLVRNHKGPSGGSALTRPSAEITLADVYSALEPGSLFHDSMISGPHAKRLTAELRRSLRAAEGALLESLRAVSLQQLMDDTANKKP